MADLACRVEPGVNGETLMANYNDLDELALDVYAEGVKSLPGRAIRNAGGAQRLGKNKVTEISTSLEDREIGIYPSLSSDQNAQFFLYVKGTEASRLFEALQTPSDESSKVLLSLLGLDKPKAAKEADRYVEVIEKIRSLIAA